MCDNCCFQLSCLRIDAIDVHSPENEKNKNNKQQTMRAQITDSQLIIAIRASVCAMCRRVRRAHEACDILSMHITHVIDF